MYFHTAILCTCPHLDARLAIGVIGNLKCHKSVFMVFADIKYSS